MENSGMWMIAILIFVVAPISFATGLVLLLKDQPVIGVCVITPGIIIGGWLAISVAQEVSYTEMNYQKYRNGTFTEQDRQAIKEHIGMPEKLATDSLTNSGEKNE